MSAPDQYQPSDQSAYQYNPQDHYVFNDSNDAQHAQPQFDAYHTTESDSSAYAWQTDDGRMRPNFVPSINQPAYGCSMREAFLRFWKKALDFRGRASRSEFWWWMLCDLLIVIVASLAIAALYRSIGGSGFPGAILGKFPLMWKMATIIPFIALSIRRLHDCGHGGKTLAVLLIMSLAGTLLGDSAGLTISHDAMHTIDGTNASLVMAAIALLLTSGSKIAYIVFMALPSRNPATRH